MTETALCALATVADRDAGNPHIHPRGFQGHPVLTRIDALDKELNFRV
jgi:hypothetical protein